MNRKTVLLASVVSFSFWLSRALFCQETVVLDTASPWRISGVLKPPVVEEAGVVRPVSIGIAWLDTPSCAVPAGWQSPSYDDSGWLRGSLGSAPYTPMLAHLCLRGRFSVEDPASAGTLVLQIRYHGGVIVFLNGAEIGRFHIRQDASGETLAVSYPKDVFVDSAGLYVSPAGLYMDGRPFAPSEDNKRRLGLWVRSCAVELPPAKVRRGENVIGIEVVRAPYDEIVNTVQVKKAFGCGDFFVPSCHIAGARLVSQGGRGLSAAGTLRAGLSVGNSDVLDDSGGFELPNPAEPLRPVRIVGPANGLFSGKILVGSDEALKGLSAEMSDVKGPAGTIPAGAATIRYGFRLGNDRTAEGMSKKPLPDYPVPAGRGAAGVVVPIWVSVKIPKGAKAGEYGGVLKVSTSGRSVEVPVEVKVVGWELPDADEYRTWVELVQSPDTLAVEYGVPLWSERHWEMIGRSFELIRPTGSRVVYIPAISHTNLGNEESMIRWVKDEAGGYRWDFSVMERYLDVAEERLGKPKVVVLQVWEVYMREGGQKRFEDFKFMGQPQVTEYDPRSGETRNVALPSLRDGASRQMWGGLIEEVRQRLRRRGLEKALMLGMFCDMVPTREDVEFFRSIAPDLGWVQQGHGFMTKLHGIADVGYNASVWGGLGFADGCRQTNQSSKPFTSSAYGWARPTLNAVYERNTGLDSYPPTRWYFFPLTGVTGEFRGIGRIGADMWKAVRNREGKRAATVPERFPEGYWGGTSISLTICNPVLCPGQDGPEATARLMALIEGVELSEARIVVEEAVKEGKVSGEAKARCEEFLQTQLFNMWRALSNLKLSGWGATAWRWGPGTAGHRWFLGSRWQEQAETLYTLAGEVARMSARQR